MAPDLVGTGGAADLDRKIVIGQAPHDGAKRAQRPGDAKSGDEDGEDRRNKQAEPDHARRNHFGGPRAGHVGRG